MMIVYGQINAENISTIIFMADVSDEAIKKALAKLTLDRDPTNWLSISYAEGSTDKLILNSVGTGGLSELSKHLKPTFQGYAYVRVTTPKNQAKYVLIQFVGEECTALKKARVIVHEEDVLSVLKPVHAQISASCAEDLSENNIFTALSSSPAQ
ncbi:Coactosin [Tritrichomonas foetus]|uniref:Coactosin n=1 Tax=Tritrichomonas foetus TaxID=1144522 RepID=A0A1J4JNM6_9EUKA|nr:Coactosin [Tritrichomonas foetus]|eukprot:OHT00040.1 Coactosin [Tritrichomonas foetus]